MIVKQALAAVMVCAGMLAGCYTSKSAYANFDKILATLVGKPYEQAFDQESGLLRGLKPTEITVLEEHRELNVYKHYFGYRVVDRGACDIFVTVDTNTNIVVSARSSGEGCYMPD